MLLFGEFIYTSGTDSCPESMRFISDMSREHVGFPGI